MGRSAVSESVGLTDSGSVVVSAVLEVSDGVGLAVSSVLEVTDGVGLSVAPVWSGCSELGDGTLVPVSFENLFPVVWSTTVNDLMAVGAGLMTMTFCASKPGQALPW